MMPICTYAAQLMWLAEILCIPFLDLFRLLKVLPLIILIFLIVLEIFYVVELCDNGFVNVLSGLQALDLMCPLNLF